MGAFNNIAALAGGFMDESDKKRKETFEQDSARRKQTVGLIGELITRSDIDEGTKGWLTQKGIEIIQAPPGKKWKFDLAEAPTRSQRKHTVPAEQMNIGGAQVTVPPVHVQEPPPPPGDIFMGQRQQGERKMSALEGAGVDVSKLSPSQRATMVTGLSLPAAPIRTRGVSLMGPNGQVIPASQDLLTGEVIGPDGQVVPNPQLVPSGGNIDEIMEPLDSANPKGPWKKRYVNRLTGQTVQEVTGLPAPAAYLDRSSTGVTIVYDANNNPVPITTTRTSGVSIPKPPPSGTVSTTGGSKAQSQISGSGGNGRVSVGEPLNFTRFNPVVGQQRRSLGAVRAQFNNLEKLITGYRDALQKGDTKRALNAGIRMNRMAGSLAVSYGKALGEVGNFAEQEQEKYQKAFYAGFPVVTAESLLDLDTNIAQDTLNDARSVLDAMEAQLPAQSGARRRDGRIQEPPKPPTSQSTLPEAAAHNLKEGKVTTFANGEKWTLQGGKPVMVSGK